MRRYVIRTGKPRADWFDDDRPMIPNLEVDDAKEVNTGLVSAKGDPIYRVAPPVGFGRNDEW